MMDTGRHEKNWCWQQQWKLRSLASSLQDEGQVYSIDHVYDQLGG